jgi:tRNA(adenine34) deaminase
MNFFKLYIDTLLKLCNQAIKRNEVPIAAIIVDPKTKKIIAKAHNLSVKNKDPLAHAEMLVIRKALKNLKTKRLDNMNIYCSLEPCTMCAAAISLAQIKNVYFCAEDKESGGVINGTKLAFSNLLKYKFSYYYGFHEKTFSRLLVDFFKKKRKKN